MLLFVLRPAQVLCFALGQKVSSIPHQHAGTSRVVLTYLHSCRYTFQLDAKVTILHAEIANSKFLSVRSETRDTHNPRSTHLLIMMPTLPTSPIFNFPASFFSLPL